MKNKIKYWLKKLSNPMLKITGLCSIILGLLSIVLQKAVNPTTGGFLYIMLGLIFLQFKVE